MVAAAVTFLLDVDNTLLDNDAVQADLRAQLETDFGAACRDRYWQIFEQLRSELGYADYLGALQRYRASAEQDPTTNDPRSSFLVDYPFAQRLYAGVLQLIGQLGRWGPTVILSDGDVVFQPRKVQRSGLWDAVDGRVLIYIHKEHMLADMQRRYPAARYVLIDDKLRILTAVKAQLGARLTSVFVRQGHYALDREAIAHYPPADLTVERIADLLLYDFSTSSPRPLWDARP
jgi:FMN phosphatase YigB (HAD superfamily)